MKPIRKKEAATNPRKSQGSQAASRPAEPEPASTGRTIRASPTRRRKPTKAKKAGKSLHPASEEYRSLFENIPDGIYRTTPDGQILSANPALIRMLGYENEAEFKHKFRADQLYLHPADRQRYLKMLDAEGGIHNFELVLKRRDGGLLIVLESVQVVRDRKGKVAYYEGVLTDITERKQIEDSLRESEAFSKAILENSPIGISVRSRTGQLLSANEAWRKLWALSEAEFEEEMEANHTVLTFEANDDYLLPHQDEVRRVYEQGGYLHLSDLQTNNTRPGSAEWISQHFYAIQNANGWVDRVIILTEDITKRKSAETALRKANLALQEALEREKIFSRTDGLTGVLTRRYFFEITQHAFETAKRYQRPLSIIMFDIDHFKLFNDTFGHQAGDELLKSVAQIARRQLRRSDILARYGGDEFVILLPDSNTAETQQAGERIRESVAAQEVEREGVRINFTLSLGIAGCVEEVATVDQLVQRADRALYQAKHAGRNRVCLYQELEESPPRC